MLNVVIWHEMAKAFSFAPKSFGDYSPFAAMQQNGKTCGSKAFVSFISEILFSVQDAQCLPFSILFAIYMFVFGSSKTHSSITVALKMRWSKSSSTLLYALHS